MKEYAHQKCAEKMNESPYYERTYKMKYEYKTISLENKSRFTKAEVNTNQLEDILNTYAQAGWELVTINPITGSYGFAYSMLLTLKRPIEA